MTKLKQAIEAAAEKGTRKFQIAHAIGVSEGTLLNWASGETKPNLEQARGLADFLDIDIDILFPTK